MTKCILRHHKRPFHDTIGIPHQESGDTPSLLHPPATQHPATSNTRRTHHYRHSTTDRSPRTIPKLDSPAAALTTQPRPRHCAPCSTPPHNPPLHPHQPQRDTSMPTTPTQPASHPPQHHRNNLFSSISVGARDSNDILVPCAVSAIDTPSSTSIVSPFSVSYGLSQIGHQISAEHRRS